MVEQNTLRRLAFIKYMFKTATEQSEAPQPLCSMSILMFHDAIELFLQLASEQVDANTNKTGFMEYWERISNQLSNGELTQKESMRRLNKARVALKHHGTKPSQHDIEAFRASAANFFQDNTSIIFDVGFSSISLSEFVQPKSAKNAIESAEDELRENNLKEALVNTALAFHHMLRHYEERQSGPRGRSPFFFGKDLTFQNSFHLGLSRRDQQGLGKLSTFVDRVTESLDAMQDAIKILALGLDYREYSVFKRLTPQVLSTVGDDVDFRLRGNPEDISVDDVQFCIDFVVETAIKLYEFDYGTRENEQKAEVNMGDIGVGP